MLPKQQSNQSEPKKRIGTQEQIDELRTAVEKSPQSPFGLRMRIIRILQNLWWEVQDIRKEIADLNARLY